MTVGISAGEMVDRRQQAIKFLEKTMKESFGSMECRKLFSTGSMTTEYVESRTQETTGGARRMVDGTTPQLITLRDGYSKRKTAFEYGVAGQFTRRDKILKRQDKFARLVNAMRKTLVDLVETTAATFIEYGDTAYASVPEVNGIAIVDPISGDGLPVFSRSHTWAGDGVNTYHTKTASFLDATQDNLYDLINEIRLWRDEQGELMSADVKRIITGQNNEQEFMEMLKSVGRSDTADRTDNILPSYFGRDGVTTYRHMVNPNEWLIETTAMNDYELLFIEEPNVRDYYDDKNEILGYNGSVFFAIGCNQPMRFYANKQ